MRGYESLSFSCCCAHTTIFSRLGSRASSSCKADDPEANYHRTTTSPPIAAMLIMRSPGSGSGGWRHSTRWQSSAVVRYRAGPPLDWCWHPRMPRVPPCVLQHMMTKPRCFVCPKHMDIFLQRVATNKRTKFFQEAGILLSPWREVFLGKVKCFLGFLGPDQLYEALLLQMEGQLLIHLQDLHSHNKSLEAGDGRERT